MMFVFIIGFGFLVYYLFFRGENTNGSLTLPRKTTAEEQLKARYVNGEIDEHTYLKMKETLKG